MHGLGNLIKSRIRAMGPLSFRDFMRMALYEPELGYYTRASLDIGKSGDFYTSPHGHAVFGHTIGMQVALCLEALKAEGAGDIRIIECGGGRGWLARDILDYLRGTVHYENLSYCLVEMNPSMARRQAAVLGTHAGRLSWAATLNELKPSDAIILSNELIDAFPVHLLEFNGCWKEVYIALQGDELAETRVEIRDSQLLEYIGRYMGTVPEGYRTEANLEAAEWLEAASAAILRGFVLTIDYGYPSYEFYAPERTRGTLLCYKGHEANEDFLQDIGQQDMTAHVNFTDLLHSGLRAGLEPAGFARQGVYLVSMGIDRAISEFFGDGGPGLEMQKIGNLIMPGTMGDTHKVLLQYKGIDPARAMKGFLMKNEVQRLRPRQAP